MISRQVLVSQLDPEARLVSLLAATTLSFEAHAGRVVLLEATGGVAYTLPAATGSGAIYHLVVNNTDAGDDTIACAGSDVFKGVLIVADVQTSTFTSIEAFVSTAGTTITFDATDSGGQAIGEWVHLIDIASGVWAVTGFLTSEDTEATPFS